jgi:hypothetical protein
MTRIISQTVQTAYSYVSLRSTQMLNIHTSWECVTDGKTRAGANFKYLMEQLLDEGYQLDIDTPTGKQLFASKQAFGAWFDAIQC